MIQAIAWSCAEHCGCLGSGQAPWKRPSPDLGSSDALAALVARPLKHYPRLALEWRYCLWAAGLALRATGWPNGGQEEIGMVGAGHDGFLEADHRYFSDYVVNGRLIGRGNLFVLTLPTSALSEVAIALGLTGPTLYIRDDAAPVAAMIRHGGELLEDGEADGVLAIWSDREAAACFALGHGAQPHASVASLEDIERSPLELARRWAAGIVAKD